MAAILPFVPSIVSGISSLFGAKGDRDARNQALASDQANFLAQQEAQQYLRNFQNLPGAQVGVGDINAVAGNRSRVDTGAGRGFADQNLSQLIGQFTRPEDGITGNESFRNNLRSQFGNFLAGSQLDPNLGTFENLAGQAGAAGQGTFQNFQQLMQQGGLGPFGQPAQNQAIQAGRGFLNQSQIAGNEAARGFDQLRQDQLGLLRKEAEPFENRALNRLQDQLFAQGRSGTTGGGIQMEGFARGLGQADLSRQLQAADQARLQQQSSLGVAQGLGGLGNQAFGAGANLASTSSNLVGEAFNRFQDTANLQQGINANIFGRQGDVLNTTANQFQQRLGLAEQGAQQPFADIMRSLGIAGTAQGLQNTFNTQDIQALQLAMQRATDAGRQQLFSAGGQGPQSNAPNILQSFDSSPFADAVGGIAGQVASTFPKIFDPASRGITKEDSAARMARKEATNQAARERLGIYD